ncbi:MAG: aminoglycoside phosphotransferase family protein [Chloroflexota bacterium]|nr:aminoglycoside phosphotransferase family protein [Chloroflexota bacterium]MDE2682828.1 aminoglycoside phosphotransferase family protein [Chloroflexota bacterium]
MFVLSEGNAVQYLVDQGVISPDDSRRARAEFLGGGISNIVIRVSLGTDRGGLVLKQSLPKLRVQEDWFADQSRIHRERAGLDFVRGLASDSATGQQIAQEVPEVVHEDRDNFVFVMTAAPADGANWKEQLLAGHIDVSVAERVGRMLGAIHQQSRVVGSSVPENLDEFADLDCFVQLRIDPYHRATAAAHPDLAEIIEGEAQRMLPTAHERRALVHGDFSPKNIIVSGTGDNARVLLLDFEVVHLGNPVFDVAFMLNHFTLKAIYNPALADRYCEAGRSFWSAYLDVLGTSMGDRNSLELDTVRQLGALLLARIDGKSPAEYITADEQKEYARRLARDILTGAVVTLSEIHNRLAGAR